ncbi:MAG: cyclic nucleotide-binding domain-containing protein [Myxococcales bacterium]|nr:cyclic nucleotide-binding domain-containing protein [Myxococcales bacterium]MCB9578434.1 cyclic nucleotide-binding domain-containing protein [Polyangiaceae bacterium]
MNVESIEKSLAEHPFVRNLSPAYVHFLSGCTKNVRFAPGDYLVREGEPANQLILMRSGSVALEINVPTRGPIQIETLEPGDVLGWSVALTPYKWHLDARALTSTLVFSVDGVCLRNKLEADHSFGLAMTRLLLGAAHERLMRARLAQLDVYSAEGK